MLWKEDKTCIVNEVRRGMRVSSGYRFCIHTLGSVGIGNYIDELHGKETPNYFVSFRKSKFLNACK